MSDIGLMLSTLQKEWATHETIELIYGLDRDDDLVWAEFRVWGARLRKRRDILRPGEVNRHALESWLQHQRLLPRKLAATRLGMTNESLQSVVDKLESQGRLIVSGLSRSNDLLSESFIRDLPRLFDDLATALFADHDDQCSALHSAIKAELGVDVEPVFCVTAAALGEAGRYAYQHDHLTNEPVSLPYQIWLDTKKPMNLRPDVCSLLTYARNQAALRDHLFAAGEPEVPSGLLAA